MTTFPVRVKIRSTTDKTSEAVVFPRCPMGLSIAPALLAEVTYFQGKVMIIEDFGEYRRMGKRIGKNACIGSDENDVFVVYRRDDHGRFVLMGQKRCAAKDGSADN